MSNEQKRTNECGVRTFAISRLGNRKRAMYTNAANVYGSNAMPYWRDFKIRDF